MRFAVVLPEAVDVSFIWKGWPVTLKPGQNIIETGFDYF